MQCAADNTMMHWCTLFIHVGCEKWITNNCTNIILHVVCLSVSSVRRYWRCFMASGSQLTHSRMCACMRMCFGMIMNDGIYSLFRWCTTVYYKLESMSQVIAKLTWRMCVLYSLSACVCAWVWKVPTNEYIDISTCMVHIFSVMNAFADPHPHTKKRKICRHCNAHSVWLSLPSNWCFFIVPQTLTEKNRYGYSSNQLVALLVEVAWYSRR